MGRSIPRFIACCFFAAPSLFVLSPFFSVLFPSFFCFCYSLAAKWYFQEKSRFQLAPFFRPLVFSFENALSFLFWHLRRFFFFSLFFPPFYFFQPSCLYNLVLYRLPISIFLQSQEKPQTFRPDSVFVCGRQNWEQLLRVTVLAHLNCFFIE